MPAATVTMPEALQAKSLYEQGWPMPKIEARLKRSRKQIKTAFRHLGVPMRSRSEAQRLRSDRMTAAERKTMNTDTFDFALLMAQAPCGFWRLP